MLMQLAFKLLKIQGALRPLLAVLANKLSQTLGRGILPKRLVVAHFHAEASVASGIFG
jgi:hypothetical protein